MLLWAWCLTGILLASDSFVPIADFDGPNPLIGWTGNGASLTVGPGHTGHGAVLEYSLGLGGSAAAVWTPAKAISAKHRAAFSLWIQASPEVKLSVLVRDDAGQRRYPFEAVTLENSTSGWRQVVVPLAPQGRVTSVGIAAERLFAPMFWGRPTDEANIARALPNARTCVRELERLKGSAEFVAGDSLSIADLMLAPQLEFFRATPEGSELLKGTSLDSWLTRMSLRASMQATQAERLRQTA